MFDIDINTDVNFGSTRESIAESIERHIESNEIKCPNEDCDCGAFTAEVRVNDSGAFEGAAICRSCNARIHLDIQDSELTSSLSELEASLRRWEDI